MDDIVNNDIYSKAVVLLNKMFDQFTDYSQMMCRTILLKANHAGYTRLTFAALHDIYIVLRHLLHSEGVYKLTFWQLGLSSFCEDGSNSGVAGRW